MSIDNDGEGGILALMALLGIKETSEACDRRSRSVRCRADLRRWRDHPRHLGPLRSRRPQYRSAGPENLYLACRGGDPRRAFRDTAPRHVADWQGLRPDHGSLVSVYCGARPMGDHATSGGAHRPKSPLWAPLPAVERLRELRCFRRGIPLRDRAEALYATWGISAPGRFGSPGRVWSSRA